MAPPPRGRPLGFLLATALLALAPCRSPTWTSPLRPSTTARRAAGDVEVLQGSAKISRKDLILPMGQLCPFRNQNVKVLIQELSALTAGIGNMAPEFMEIQRGIQTGILPDAQKIRNVGEALQARVKDMRATLNAFEGSKDYQALETYAGMDVKSRVLTAPSIRVVADVMQWQADGLLAAADFQPPPPPPPGLDLASLQQAVQVEPKPMLQMNLCAPFRADDFVGHAMLKQEFERLYRDHDQLMGMGITYADFDIAGKEYFLGQLDIVATRWEELMVQAQEAGVPVREEYTQNCNAVLQHSGISVQQYKASLEEIRAMFDEQLEVQKSRR